MDPDIGLTFPATVAAALAGAPPLAFAAADAPFVALLVALGVAVGVVIGAGATHLMHRRRDASRPDEVVRSPIRRSRAGHTEDPIVVALVGGDNDARARRRRRPIGSGMHRPPGESPPPT